MKIIKSENEISKYCRNLKTPTSFVATMGSLHKGHIRLMDEAKKYSDILIASLFINPLQFNNPGDLSSYPKNLEKDIKIFEQNNVDLLYIPEEKDIISPELKNIDSGLQGKILEGKYRPGHFDGVLTIVNKFFEIIKPDFAFFGIKDIQQLCLIFSKLSSMHNIKIIPVETERDSNGLALSSRNNLLSASERKAAAIIFKGLDSLSKEIKINKSVNIHNYLSNFYNQNKLIELEYILIENLSIFNEKNIFIYDLFEGKKCKVVMVAAKIGEVRLIDNLIIN
tara:strand:- start:2721 stop:3563 length:843 start_codon:yes stop_codon:yes gene_type:complete